MAEKNGAITGRKKWGYGLIGLGLALIILLILVKSNFDAQGAFLCQNIEASGGDMLACPVHKTDTSWMFLGGFGIALAIVFAGIYLGFLDRRTVEADPEVTRSSNFDHVDVSSLDEEARKVVELLKTREGAVFQSDLVRDTGFSKVRISRILDRLEQGKLIERKRRGMANLVVLR